MARKPMTDAQKQAFKERMAAARAAKKAGNEGRIIDATIAHMKKPRTKVRASKTVRDTGYQGDTGNLNLTPGRLSASERRYMASTYPLAVWQPPAGPMYGPEPKPKGWKSPRKPRAPKAPKQTQAAPPEEPKQKGRRMAKKSEGPTKAELLAKISRMGKGRPKDLKKIEQLETKIEKQKEQANEKEGMAESIVLASVGAGASALADASDAGKKMLRKTGFPPSSVVATVAIGAAFKVKSKKARRRLLALGIGCATVSVATKALSKAQEAFPDAFDGIDEGASFPDAEGSASDVAVTSPAI